ncbi:phosphinothricin acetyltransferase [Rhizomicrobium palustre]|uniref:Phosphinothricin acetyltransferase n=1 Tax=Rhizomicrobium palustre TaxID=189966 RepID=A0A846N2L1_9PROT|nr:GNAT family N-acetyltransferase [Rhizomicrobium palustre]NIK89462.1 phosphinothricin acetyltransferase [Rhizomicrobium palustre]
MSDVLIRHVEQNDLSALLAIYNHYVETTAVTFDLGPRTLEQRQVWLDSFAREGRWQCFVAVQKGEPVGWACSGKFREKDAYLTTVETSIYLKPGIGGQGLGTRLYATLFEALAKEDVHRAIGCLTIPNESSVALHKKLGFQHVGDFHQVGRKFGRFWDITWYEKAL